MQWTCLYLCFNLWFIPDPVRVEMKFLLVVVALLGAGMASEDLVAGDHRPDLDLPMDKCTALGQFLLHPTNRCQYIRCTYGPEPWKDDYGKRLYGVVQYCPIGTAVSRKLYLYGHGYYYGNVPGSRHGYDQKYGSEFSNDYGHGHGHGYGSDHSHGHDYGYGKNNPYNYGQFYGYGYSYGYDEGHADGGLPLDVTQLCAERIHLYGYGDQCKAHDQHQEARQNYNDDRNNRRHGSGAFSRRGYPNTWTKY